LARGFQRFQSAEMLRRNNLMHFGRSLISINNPGRPNSVR
jgi:hypothetical protein